MTKTLNQAFKAFLLVLIVLHGLLSGVQAEILVPVQDQTLVDVTVETNVVFDPTTQLYTYSYLVVCNNTHFKTTFIEIGCKLMILR